MGFKVVNRQSPNIGGCRFCSCTKTVIDKTPPTISKVDKVTSTPTKVTKKIGKQRCYLHIQRILFSCSFFDLQF